MKKIIKTLLVVMVVVLALTAFVACEKECAHTGGTATCTEAAVCELCGASYGSPLGHSESFTTPVDPTCTEAGISGKSYCTRCDAVLVEEIVIPATGHTAGDAATCTTAQKCETCGVVLVEALGHTDADENHVCETCEEKLHVNKLVVGEGNKIVVYGDTLNAWNLPIEWVAFTVEEAGTYTFTGDNGALVYVFDADGNSLCGYTGVATLEAGAYLICVGNGATGVMNVTVTFTAAAAPAPHEHEYAEVVTNPTCTAAGYTTYTCACGESYTGNEVAATGHDYDHVVTNPTCTAAGYTTHTCAFCDHSYTDSEVEATGHADENGDYKCDSCSTKMLPADGTTLTIPQALAIAKLVGTTYTTEKYYITGTITNVYNTTYGNMYIEDAEGNELCIYGLYTWNKAVRYDAMTNKPVVGDEVTVYTVLGAYGTTYQGKDAWLDDFVAHEHNYKSVVTDPTCFEEGYTTHTCTLCGYVTKDTETEALGHTVEQGTCERCGNEIGGDGPVIVEKTYSYDFTAAQFSANGTKTLNDVAWTLAGDGGYWGYDSQYGKGQQFGSGNKPYKSLTLTSTSFTNVSKIVINTSGASSIAGKCNVYVGETLVETITLTSTATSYTIDVSDLTGEIKLEYTQTSSKAIYLKSIQVDYAISE